MRILLAGLLAFGLSAQSFAYTEGLAPFKTRDGAPPSPLSSGMELPRENRLPPGPNLKPVDQLPTPSTEAPVTPRPVQRPAARPKAPPLPVVEKKNTNPFGIPDAAIDLIPAIKEQLSLPALGMTPGSPRLMNQNVVRVGDGRNEVVYASFRQPNRISTPFKSARVIDMSGSPIQIVGSDIYFTPNAEEPVGLFISDESGESSQVASITIVPANIPGQNISLVFNTSKDLPEDLLAVGPNASHIDIVRSVLASAINGEAPQGFEWSKLNVGLARIGNMLVSPKTLMSSSDHNVFIYELKNVGEKDIELSEQSFYEDGVMGVAFWPKIMIKSGEVSHVHIMAMKPLEN